MVERDSDKVTLILNMHLIGVFILKLVFTCKCIVQLILLKCTYKQKSTLPPIDHL